MKSNTKSNLTIIGIILVLLTIIITNFYYVKNTDNKSLDYSDDFTLDKDNLKISALSPPIYINDTNPSYNWSVAKKAGICTGNGTYSEPYMIEDLVIDSGGSESCILIENSDVYFRIENCTLSNAGSSFGEAGISLTDVRNAQIVDNDCSSNYVGIFLSRIYYSNITRNTASNNGYNGIWVYSSDYINISGNTLNSNSNYGLSLRYSTNNYISGNTLNFNQFGIELWSGGYGGGGGNNITGNSIYSNSIRGIYLANSYEYIIGNNINGNGEAGIYIFHSFNNEIIGNIIVNNGIGIHLYSYNTYNNDISGNNISLHSMYGIYLDNVENNDIISNTITNNNIGIFSLSSENNQIEGNFFSGNNEDIRYYNPLPPELSILLILSIGVIIGVSILMTGMIVYERKVHSSFPTIGTLSIIFDIIGILIVAFTFNPEFGGTDSFIVFAALPFTGIGLLIGYVGFHSKRDSIPVLELVGAAVGFIFSLISLWPLILLIVAMGVG